MTQAQEQALLRQYLATCARLHGGFSRTAREAEPLMPVGPDRIDDLTYADETTVLSYLKRFEQFEDALNRTLKLLSKAMELGKVERLTAIDVTRRAASLGILDSEKVWEDAVRTRNTLAHEYPLDPVKRADQVAAAWRSRMTLFTTWTAIQRFVSEERLLDD